MKKLIVFITISFAAILTVFSQNAAITGNAKTYAGDSLMLYTYSDYLVKNKVFLDESKVDSLGNFSITVNVAETMRAYIDLNVFRGVIYIEAGKKYNVVLPKKTLKNDEDKLNPFFRMQDFYLQSGKKDKNDLNYAVRKFDALYNYYLDRLFDNYKGKVNSKATEDVIKAIDDSLSHISNSFFEEYKKYEYATLRFMTYMRKKEQIIK